MSTTTILIFVGLIMLILGSVALILFENNARRKQPKRAIQSTGKKPSLIKKSTWLTWYRRVDGFYLTRHAIRKIYKQIMQLSVYNSAEARIKSIQVWLIITSVELVGLIAAIIVFRDIIMIMLVYLFIYIVKDILIVKQVDRIHMQVLNDTIVALSNLRQTYMRLNSVADSVAETEVSPLLQSSFDDIYLILTSSGGDQLLEEFYTTTPFKLLRTLASVCYKLDSAGDTKLHDGSSNFLMSLNMITNEAQVEVRKLTNQKLLFGSLEYMPVAPIVAVPAIEWFFTGTIPGTAVIFGGFIGYMAKVCIVILCIVGYMSITRMNSATPIRKDDRSEIITNLLRIEMFDRLVYNVMPKSKKRIVRVNLLLRGSLSTQNIKHVYASKILYSTSAFIFALVVAVSSNLLAKDFLYSNIRETSLVASEDLTAEDIKIRIEMDAIYLAYPELPNEEVTADLVRQYLPALTELKRQDQIARLMTKYNSYHNTYFKWWHLLLCTLLSIAVWWAPDFILKFRRKLAQSEAEEDVLQLQTTISILMFCNADTLETLEWLQKQSDIHKNILIDCYHEYPSNPEIALQKLKSKVSIMDFKRIVDKLILTIHQVSLYEAFSDLLIEREHTMRIREMTQDKALKKKRGMAKPIAMAPLYAVIVLYFLMPIGYLGYLEFVDAMAGMNV